MKMLRGIGLMSVCGSFLAACSAGPGSEVEVAEASPAETQVEALSANALTPAQAKTVLKLIDDICADTWCSGDYNFGFRRLSCNRAAKTCTLTLQVLPRAGALGEPRGYWRSCKTAGFEGFASLVDSADNGYRSLDDDYYAALTECTTRIVSHLP